MFTIGRIAYRQEWIFFPIEQRNRLIADNVMQHKGSLRHCGIC